MSEEKKEKSTANLGKDMQKIDEFVTEVERHKAEDVKEIKVEDVTLLEMSSKIIGYRSILEDIAMAKGELEMAFWQRIHKLYPEIDLTVNAKERWTYNNNAGCLERRDC